MSTKAKLSATERALSILEEDDFFGKIRDAVERCGLVGEERNAVAIYVIVISSLLDRPLNVIIKGVSSAGKNWLATRVLKLVPKEAVREITSSSKAAWNYSRDDFRNRIVYLPERNEAAGAVHPVRLLISEGKLIRTVTVREGGKLKAEEFVAEGPIASISTTTRDRIEIDDENRHVSVWIDESPEQTRRITFRKLSPLPQLDEDEIAVWYEVYKLIQKRASVPVKFPDWLIQIADKVPTDVRVRRYFPAFLEALRTVALIHSFWIHAEDYEPGEVITAQFRDYAIAAFIFNDVFVESLDRGDDECVATSKAVEAIASTQDEKPVDADQLAKFLNISYDKASARLRAALEAGMIVRANESERNNNKRYIASKVRRFVPDPAEVVELVEINKPITLSHPVSGEEIKLPSKRRSSKA